MKTTIFRDFAKYATFNVMGMIGLSCYILADTFFIAAGLGSNGLTALNLAIPIYSFIHGSGLMIGIGGGIKYTIHQSTGDRKAANRIFTNTLYLTAAFAALFMTLGIFAAGPIATLLGADAAVFEMTRIYLQIILLFAPAFLSNNVLLCFVRNDGAPGLAMAAMLTGSFSNILLDWILIFPCNMGIFGAVLATGMAPVISMLVMSPFFLQKKNRFHIVKCAPGKHQALEILSNGVPSLLTELSSGIVMIVFNFIILGLEGNVGVAAYGVVANLSLVVVSVYTGIAQGIQPIISQNYGIGHCKNITAIMKYALITMMIFSLIIYGIMYIGAAPIAAIFNSEQNVLLQSIAEIGLKLYFTACPFVGFNIILSMYFIAVDCPVPAQWLSLLRGFLVIIPMTFVLAWLLQIYGVWLSFPATESAVAVIGILWYQKLLKKASAAS